MQYNTKPFYSYDIKIRIEHDLENLIVEEELEENKEAKAEDFYTYKSFSFYHNNTNILVKDFEYSIPGTTNMTIALFPSLPGIWVDGKRNENMVSYDFYMKEKSTEKYCDGSFSDLEKDEKILIYSNLENIIFEFMRYLKEGTVKYNTEYDYFECYLKGTNKAQLCSFYI